MNKENTKPCVCNNCGKAGFCLYEAKEMAYCPTFIRKRVDVKKNLTYSPFKVLPKIKR